MYYNARFYDPSFGRFLTADTIVPDPANAQGFNRYAYVINNPIIYTDPSGHWVHIAVGAAVGAIVTAANGGSTEEILAGAVIGAAAAATGGAAAGAVSAAGGSAVAVGMASGAASGAVSGGLTALYNGENMQTATEMAFQGAVKGAITGSVSSVVQEGTADFLGEVELFGGADLSNEAIDIWSDTAAGAVCGGIDAYMNGEGVGKGVLKGGVISFGMSGGIGMTKDYMFPSDSTQKTWYGNLADTVTGFYNNNNWMKDNKGYYNYYSGKVGVKSPNAFSMTLDFFNRSQLAFHSTPIIVPLVTSVPTI
jgi:hypothetical protein